MTNKDIIPTLRKASKNWTATGFNRENVIKKVANIIFNVVFQWLWLTWKNLMEYITLLVFITTLQLFTSHVCCFQNFPIIQRIVHINATLKLSCLSVSHLIILSPTPCYQSISLVALITIIWFNACVLNMPEFHRFLRMTSKHLP